MKKLLGYITLLSLSFLGIAFAFLYGSLWNAFSLQSTTSVSTWWTLIGLVSLTLAIFLILGIVVEVKGGKLCPDGKKRLKNGKCP